MRKFIGTALAVLCMTFLAVGAASAQYDRDHDHDRDRDNRTNMHDGHHWRVKHSNYITDDRGADLLRQAVRNGYQQGYQAGSSDRSSRHNNWRRNQTYVSANMGWENGVDQSQYRYYFQQGFQKGYDDAFYNRNRYGRDNNILDNVLTGILGIGRY
ncbi:MAG: hypothetical protein ACJ73D_07840 [Pyrinomonadaceae bacterium]